MAKLATGGRNSRSACQYFRSPRRILVLGKILQDQGPITVTTVTSSAGVTGSLVIMQFWYRHSVMTVSLVTCVRHSHDRRHL